MADLKEQIEDLRRRINSVGDDPAPNTLTELEPDFSHCRDDSRAGSPRPYSY